MADVRQSIVLGVEIDQLSPGSADSFECRVQTVCVPGDGESLFFEEVADDIVGSVFSVCEFGMGPNLTQSVIVLSYVSAHELNTSRFSSRSDECKELMPSSTAALTSAIGDILTIV